MKIFDLDWLTKEQQKVDQYQLQQIGVDMSARPISRFPGRAPTRIALYMFDYTKSSVIMAYFGKPSLAKLEKLRSLYRISVRGNQNAIGWIKIEYDRAGIIAREVMIPRTQVATSYLHANWGVYHPSIWQQATMAWLSYPYRIENGAYIISEGVRR